MSSLKTTKIDNETILKIHSLSTDLSEKTIKKTFSTLLQCILYNYMDESKTYIPYLGNLSIEHTDDIKENGLSKAKLTIEIDASDFLCTAIGNIDDGELTEVDKFLIENIGYELENKLEQG